MLVKQGCRVEGFDLSPAMVEVAKGRIRTENIAEHFTVKTMGVEYMDNLPHSTFDTVVATLVFSELSDDERRFALKHSHRVIKSNGRLIIADEVVPRKKLYRLIHSLLRLPLVVATFLISRRLTRPIAHLTEEVNSAGFDIEMEQRSQAEAFAMVIGRKKNSEMPSMVTKDKKGNSSVRRED
jgi:ubiquinone/menaquinone biosynthesis C-methylase UbiE